MNITKDKLISLKDRVEPNSRFETIQKLFETILEDDYTVTFDNEEVKIGGKILTFKDGLPTIKYFGPEEDNMTFNNAYQGIVKMANVFEDYEDIVKKIGCLLGGFDFETHKMIDKYRIISNKIKYKDDYHGSLLSNGESRHPSSHFSDNNYFFNIMYFIQNGNFDDVTMVLRYPTQRYFKVEDDDKHYTEEYKKQKEVLSFRFPPKFLWMWANRETVIHPYSLMAFRKFLNSEYGKSILIHINKEYTPYSITTMSFQEFPDVWKKISDEILKDLGVSTDNKDEISNISKLISNLMTQETDIKNISDLLVIGNRAVILWGPPGTGKTYESMEVVKELLEIEEEDIEDKYLFSKQSEYRDTQGYYEIVQFHPNYTYEDFIGGISPKLDGNSVSYELREGIFYRFCREAEKNLDRKYIFIIDEINRAELSAVFGELLFALEYRSKHINLAHFGSFTIPKNVYIIGTMNNVDKSLVTFDLALRRRFGFFKLMPKLDVISDVLGEMVEEESLNKYIEKCKELNKKIVTELGLGEDYQIGQAYFLKIKDFLKEGDNIQISSFDLERLWIYNLEPLLEEYLGMSIEDEGIGKKLLALKDDFENL